MRASSFFLIFGLSDCIRWLSTILHRPGEKATFAHQLQSCIPISILKRVRVARKAAVVDPVLPLWRLATSWQRNSEARQRGQPEGGVGPGSESEGECKRWAGVYLRKAASSVCSFILSNLSLQIFMTLLTSPASAICLERFVQPTDVQCRCQQEGVSSS
jgi:hypothetical protein